MTTDNTAEPVPGLRDQIAGAVDRGDGHSCAYQEGIDAEEIADAVLAVVQPAIDQAREEASALRTELAIQKSITADLRVENEARGAKLAALHELEQPHEDEGIVPTPEQWIWKWNRATTEQRLAVARRVQALGRQNDRVQAVARDWAEAQPLLPGQALADLANALSDEPQPVMCHSVRIGKHYIRVHGDRVPTPDEQAAIGALLDATEAALTPPAPADQPEGGVV